MSAPISITPQDFLDMFQPKVVISGDGSQGAEFWNRILPYIAGLAAASAGGCAFVKAQADGTSTLTVAALVGIDYADIGAVLVANVNFYIGNGIASYDSVTGTFTWELDYPIAGTPAIIFYNA